MTTRKEAAAFAETVLDACAAGRVRQISRVVTAHYDDVLRAHGVTANQLTILCILAVLGPSRSVDLEPYLASEQSTLSRNLDRMIKNGWLVKKKDADGRASRITLTTTGRRLVQDASASWREAQDWAEDLLGPRGLADLKRVAKKLNPLIP